MSLEQALAANTAALEALTAALKAAPTTAAAPAPKAEKPTKAEKAEKAEKAAAYEARFDKAQMTAALNEVKEAKGVPEAKRIIKEVGKAEKMADIADPALIDAVYDECKKVMSAEDGDM